MALQSAVNEKEKKSAFVSLANKSANHLAKQRSDKKHKKRVNGAVFSKLIQFIALAAFITSKQGCITAMSIAKLNGL